MKVGVGGLHNVPVRGCRTFYFFPDRQLYVMFLDQSIDMDMTTGIYASCALINPIFLSKTITATPAFGLCF